VRSSPDVDVLIGWQRRLIVALAVIVTVVVADQLTKSWAVRRLTREPCSVPDACIDVVGSLRFRLSFNPGAAFSSFTGGGPVLGVIAFFMTIYLVYLTVTSSDRVLRWLFPVVAGGAVGNLWDRVFRADDGLLSGKVVDFIDLQFWPIFNVADMAIVCGIIGVAFRLITHPVDETTADAAESTTATGDSVPAAASDDSVPAAASDDSALAAASDDSDNGDPP